MSKADQNAAKAGDQKLSTDVTADTDKTSANITGLQNAAIGNANSARTDTTSQIGTTNSTLADAASGYKDTAGIAKDMATTGGYTPAQETAFKNQATSGVKNTYDVLAQNAQQNMTRTGAASGPAAISQMARQGAQAQATAATGANVALNTQENANKATGLSQLNNANSGLTSVGNAQANVAGIDKSLYDTDTNTVTTEGAQLLQNLGLKYNTQAQAQQLLSTLASQTKGPMDNIMSVANTAIGAAKAFSPSGYSTK